MERRTAPHPRVAVETVEGVQALPMQDSAPSWNVIIPVCISPLHLHITQLERLVAVTVAVR
jgi:hypothetical protein